MKYNFDEPVERKNTNSVKYDGLKKFMNVDDALPMWVADMDFKAPPCIIDALKSRLEHEVLGYTFKPDIYNKSIVDWMQQYHKWSIKDEWISFSPGVVAGFTMAIEQFTQPGDKIIVQPPVYFPFFDSVKHTGRQLVENPLKLKDGRLNMDFDDLKSKIDGDVKILLLCNPHNPGGSVWTKNELIELNEICVKNDILVISDEIHADIVFKPNVFTPFASISESAAQNSITVRSHSKTFNVAGLTTSYVIIPNKRLLHQYNKKLNTPHLHMGNIFGTEALIAAYNKGHNWLKELLDYLKRNIDFVENFVKEQMPQLKVVRPESTFLVWVDCRALNLSTKEQWDFFMNKAKVAVNEGSMFGTGGEGFVRLNVGCTQKTLAEALTRIKKALNE